MKILFANIGHPVFRATSLSSRGPLEKLRRWKNVEKTTTPRRRQSFYKAASCPFISSESTEPQRIGVKILLSESQLILHFAQETQLQMWTRTRSLKSHPRTFEPYQTTHVQCGGPRKLGAAAQREIRNIAEDLRLIKARDDAWLEKKCLTWTTLRNNSRRSVGRILLLELMSRVFTSSK